MYNWIDHWPLFLLKLQLPAMLSGTFLYTFLTFIFYCLFQVSTLSPEFLQETSNSIFVLQRNSVLFVFLHPLRFCSRTFFHQKVHQIIFLNIVTSTLDINYASFLRMQTMQLYFIVSDLKLKFEIWKMYFRTDKISFFLFSRIKNCVCIGMAIQYYSNDIVSAV